ncbi:hypothetical protein BC829DRAFT_392754 [Chytridium lagenaria]|nr:hypothetical protein BC829DRAFT_392754 [Chytridium lagenaria]
MLENTSPTTPPSQSNSIFNVVVVSKPNNPLTNTLTGSDPSANNLSHPQSPSTSASSSPPVGIIGGVLGGCVVIAGAAALHILRRRPTKPPPNNPPYKFTPPSDITKLHIDSTPFPIAKTPPPSSSHPNNITTPLNNITTPQISPQHKLATPQISPPAQAYRNHPVYPPHSKHSNDHSLFPGATSSNGGDAPPLYRENTGIRPTWESKGKM